MGIVVCAKGVEETLFQVLEPSEDHCQWKVILFLVLPPRIEALAMSWRSSRR